MRGTTAYQVPNRASTLSIPHTEYPPHVAAAAQEKLLWVKALLEHGGAIVNECMLWEEEEEKHFYTKNWTWHGDNCLFSAVRHSHWQVVNYLLTTYLRPSTVQAVETNRRIDRLYLMTDVQVCMECDVHDTLHGLAAKLRGVSDGARRIAEDIERMVLFPSQSRAMPGLDVKDVTARFAPPSPQQRGGSTQAPQDPRALLAHVLIHSFVVQLIDVVLTRRCSTVRAVRKLLELRFGVRFSTCEQRSFVPKLLVDVLLKYPAQVNQCATYNTAQGRRRLCFVWEFALDREGRALCDWTPSARSKPRSTIKVWRGEAPQKNSTTYSVMRRQLRHRRWRRRSITS